MRQSKVSGRAVKTTGNWPVPLDPMEEEGGGGVEVLMRWHGGGVVSQG